MVKKVEEYQDYAKRIHILGAEIDRLRAENKAYDEDARRIRLKFADGLAHEKRL
jgi:cell division protein FtsB